MRTNLMRTTLNVAILAAMTLFASACGPQTESPSFVRVENGKFIRNSRPYSYIGTNFWYGPILASEGEGKNSQGILHRYKYNKPFTHQQMQIRTKPILFFRYLCKVENQDEKFMREALREAQAALAAGEIPIGAVIVSRGRVIGRGHNMTERLIDTTAHAEMVAITAATEAIGGKYLTDCTLYVTVEPCPMCAGALNWAQVGRIVYGAIDPRRGYTLFSPSLLHPRTQVTAGVLGGECTALMQDFFRSKR
jgi:tRNA(adenine34) deaminase